MTELLGHIWNPRIQRDQRRLRDQAIPVWLRAVRGARPIAKPRKDPQHTRSPRPHARPRQHCRYVQLVWREAEIHPINRAGADRESGIPVLGPSTPPTVMTKH